MVELSTERIDEILYKETQKTVDLPTLLRSIYTRYMHLYESYLADIDTLNDEKIAELKKYHEETIDECGSVGDYCLARKRRNG